MSPLTARIPARRPVPRRGFCTTIHTLIPRSCSARGERARVQRYRLCGTSRQPIDRRTSSGWSKISVAGHRRPVDLVDPFDCRRRPAGPDSQARRRSRYRCPMPDFSVATHRRGRFPPYVPARSQREERHGSADRRTHARFLAAPPRTSRFMLMKTSIGASSSPSLPGLGRFEAVARIAARETGLRVVPPSGKICRGLTKSVSSSEPWPLRTFHKLLFS